MTVERADLRIERRASSSQASPICRIWSLKSKALLLRTSNVYHRTICRSALKLKSWSQLMLYLHSNNCLILTFSSALTKRNLSMALKVSWKTMVRK